MCIQLHSLSTPIKSYTLTVNANANEDILLNSIFHRASKTTNLLVLFLYIILYPHSLHLIGSLDFISFSVWHSPHIYIIGCCFGGWTSFWVSIIRLWNHRLQYWISQNGLLTNSTSPHFSQAKLKGSQLPSVLFQTLLVGLKEWVGGELQHVAHLHRNWTQ